MNKKLVSYIIKMKKNALLKWHKEIAIIVPMNLYKSYKNV